MTRTAKRRRPQKVFTLDPDTITKLDELADVLEKWPSHVIDQAVAFLYELKVASK